MTRLGLERSIIDGGAYERAVRHFTEAGIVLPTFAEIADPGTQPDHVRAALPSVDPDAPHPLNLFRVNWYNARDRRGRGALPHHVVVPPGLSGVAAPIAVVLGNRFPMIRAHKVLAAYACLVPRIVTGQFDPSTHRAVWPSTGNYCRGGVAISRILGCRGVAVLPEGMSRERFQWLERWVQDPSDIVRTPGTESNVKEIYDACAVLASDERNVIFNQFCEFGNHLAHYHCTGPALGQTAEALMARQPGLHAAAFVAATGSAGTLGAGDFLKERFGSRTVAVEALECPTLLCNGFGEHNIQGIGDKHVPFIHNVMNTDVVVGVSDQATDALGVMFSSVEGRRYLADRRGAGEEVLEALDDLGLSSICNIVAAIKVAKRFDLGPDDLILTVATDGAEMYASEREKVMARRFAVGFDSTTAAEVFGQHVVGASEDHVLDLVERDRERIFNLGYYTWVEQQGVGVDDFVARRHQTFWRDLRPLVTAWDELITAFNERAAGRRP